MSVGKGEGNAGESKRGKQTRSAALSGGGKTSRVRQTSRSQEPPEHDARWSGSRWRSDLRRRLLAWFEKNAREMPWRSDPTPYHVWVSEIMLQQTQVATVLPYYGRWMQSFPTVADLAAADEAVLMRHWEGLGYYRRVRSMHQAAKNIMEEHGGEFPTRYEDVLALPGVGRYTAGAVLSISTDARLPILEGNTHRVFSRLIGLRMPPAEKPASDLLWRFAEAMLPKLGSGQFNQAAMELGALVCVPRNPKCDACPIRSHCAARESGLQQEIPGKVKKLDYVDRSEFAFVISRGEGSAVQYLARPIPEGGRWAGLWDFPRPTDQATEDVAEAARWLSDSLGVPINVGVRLKTLRHAVTKYRITLHVHEAKLKRARRLGKHAEKSAWKWVSAEELGELPLSVSGRKIAEFLSRNRQTVLPLQ